jgi:hypothetical protein
MKIKVRKKQLRKVLRKASRSRPIDAVFPRLPELRQNDYRTKLYGLKALQYLSRRYGFKYLPFRTYVGPESFSINHFSNFSNGRIIIRTDPMRRDCVQTMEEWFSVPRLNFYLDRQPPKKSELLIKRWMRKAKKKNPNLCFLVHKVRPLSDYEMSIQINVDLQQREIKISTTKARTDKFRDEDVQTMHVSLGEDDRIEFRSQTSIFPERLHSSVLSMLNEAVFFAKITGHQSFELSGVTYKDAPEKPEYYDWIFGKGF